MYKMIVSMQGGECIVLTILIGLEKGLTLSLEQTGHRNIPSQSLLCPLWSRQVLHLSP